MPILPFAQIPLDIAFDESLTMADIRVYLAIDHLCGKRGWWVCGQEVLASKTGLGERSVQRSVATLRERGYIVTVRLGAQSGTRLRYELPARTGRDGWWSDPPELADHSRPTRQVDPTDPPSRSDRPANLGGSSTTDLISTDLISTDPKARFARARAPEGQPALGLEEPDPSGLSQSGVEMRDTLLSRLGRYAHDAGMFEDAEIFARDFEGRWSEFNHALIECSRDRKRPYPGNLREYMPGPLGRERRRSNDGRNDPDPEKRTATPSPFARYS